MMPKVFKALLHFIYTDQLSIDDPNNNETPVELLQDLFAVADRYALDELTHLCAEQLARKLSVDTLATTLLLADQHSHTELKMKCFHFASVPENFSLIALTEGYLQIMQASPTLFAELSAKVKGSSRLTSYFAKNKQTIY